MPRVLIGPATLKEVDGEYRAILRRSGFELVFPPRHAQMIEEELIHRLTGCDAALAGSEPYTRRVIAANSQLRIVARAGVGYDAVDVSACTEFGIPVTISPGNSEGVAEHTFGLMLVLAKTLFDQHNTIAGGGWPRKSNLPLRGTTLAIAGLGRVGKQVAIRGRAFGMRVIAYDPISFPEFATTHGVSVCDFDNLFVDGDFVSLHVPLNAQTRWLVGAKQLNMMKPTAFLINTARGGVVNEAELYECLRDRRIAGAGLDVFDCEPPAADNPIRQLPNVILTAHTAGVDERARDDMALIAASAIVSFWKGIWPADLVVNPEVRPKVKWAAGGS
jgi:phosphoglycerate dehydrogenase-like enzyme